MLPQDSWLFKGTLRENIDVQNRFTDKDVWGVLKMVHLKTTVEGFPSQLHHEVEEKGSNLSMGTVQLICLARVLLKKPRLIIMDEATSSVDIETDTIVQTTIGSAFKEQTVLTIAHRLHTIIDFDKILVLDNGQVSEFGHPADLLENHPEGIFSELCRHTGKVSAAQLLLRAQEARSSERKSRLESKQ